jgi:hypothetical protein
MFFDARNRYIRPAHPGGLTGKTGTFPAPLTKHNSMLCPISRKKLAYIAPILFPEGTGVSKLNLELSYQEKYNVIRL